MPKPTKKTVKCPECKTDVVIYSDTSDKHPGVCDECGLNVQAVYERKRHEDAVKALEPKKKSSAFDW